VILLFSPALNIFWVFNQIALKMLPGSNDCMPRFRQHEGSRSYFGHQDRSILSTSIKTKVWVYPKLELDLELFKFSNPKLGHRRKNFRMPCRIYVPFHVGWEMLWLHQDFLIIGMVQVGCGELQWGITRVGILLFSDVFLALINMPKICIFNRFLGFLADSSQ